jgi:hypothetical protein
MSLILNFNGEMIFFCSSYSSLSVHKANHEISTRMEDSESKCRHCNEDKSADGLHGIQKDCLFQISHRLTI